MKLEPLSPLHDDDLELLVLIKQFELSLLELFGRGQLNGTTHTCLGQEYIPVALRGVLGDDDFIFSNHRGHGHYLARFQDPTGLLAEIMGKAGAVCNGVGGSQHIYRKNYLSTGIQGESLPVAVGTALHLKHRRKHGLAVVHIGDGTWGEGAVYEALNMAQLWQLPLLVVVENNQIAQSTPNWLQMAGTISGRVQGFGVEYLHSASVDINQIREQVGPAIQRARRDCQPLVLEFATCRLGPHSKGDDTRDEAEIQRAQATDCLARYGQQFPAQVRRAQATIQPQIEQVLSEVKGRLLTTWMPH